MKLILITIVYLTSLCSSAQFPMDFFINKSADAVIIYYAEHIGGPPEDGSSNRPTSLKIDSLPVILKINPCKGTYSHFSCAEDSVYFTLEFHYKDFKCNKIAIRSTSKACADTYFENFLRDTDKLVWKKNKDETIVTSKIFRTQEVLGVMTYYFLEISIEEGQILLEESSIPKSEWKKFKKGLKNLD